MTIDLGLEELLENKDSSEGNNKKNGFTLENKSSSLFDELNSLYSKQNFPEIKKRLEKIFNENDKDSVLWIHARFWELLINLEEKTFPSFVLLAPFGEICERIKLGKNKNQEDLSLDDVLKVGRILYEKFFDVLTESNEETLLNTLCQYKNIFGDDKDFEEKNRQQLVHSKRGEDYISEITLSKQFTNNKNRRKKVYILFWTILVFGTIIICLNESFHFKRAIKNPDAISFFSAEYEPEFFKNDFFAVEKSLDISDPEKSDLNFEALSILAEKTLPTNKRKNLKTKSNFVPGIYIVKVKTKVIMNPQDDARSIGTLSEKDKVKVVGQIGAYYQIASKDGSVFGYIMKKDVINTKHSFGDN